MSKPETDNDKIDLVVSSRFRGTTFTKPKIDIQSKCEISGLAGADPIPYSLNTETYDNLRDTLVANPRTLVLHLAPADIDFWSEQDEISYNLKHCSYWLSLRGLPDVANTTTKTVYIPRANLFSASALRG